MPMPNRQVQHQNTALELIRSQPCRYLAVLDCDEYLFPLSSDQSTKDILIQLFKDNPKISAIEAPWWCQGSSGLTCQPQSIRKNFLWCKPHPGFWEECFRKLGHWKKTIYKTDDIIKLHIHGGRTKGQTLSHWKTANLLRINHYKIMSREQFFKVKATRGDADRLEWTHLRNDSYFHEFDFKDILDDSLKKRVESREKLCDTV